MKVKLESVEDKFSRFKIAAIWNISRFSFLRYNFVLSWADSNVFMLT